MKKHTKIYCKYFNIGEQDTPICEVCGDIAVDINHIDPRGIGGKNPSKDHIDNLIGLCRLCHLRAEKQKKPYLTKEEQKEIIKNRQ